MSLLKIKTTNRKFYNKWLYKVSVRVKGAGVFRNVPLEGIKEFCDALRTKDQRHYLSSTLKILANQEIIIDLANFLSDVDKSLWSKRVERDAIDFYTNDSELYQRLATNFSHLVIHQFEPSGNSALLDQHQVIVGKKLPHDRYQYRVYLLPHKMAGDREGKRRYLDWVKQQGDKIRLSDAVDSWFMHTDWNWDRRYILVEDDQTLLMLKLRGADVVGRIYNYVVTDK